MSISDPQITLNRLGCVKKMTEMRSKVLNIYTNFVVFKKNLNLKTCVFSILSIGLQKLTKMIENHFISDPQIILNRLGCVENDRNETNS